MTVGEQAPRDRPEAEATHEPAGSGNPAEVQRDGVQPDGVQDQALQQRQPAPADVLGGPFTTRQLLRLDEALRVADSSTGLIFSVYVGELDEPIRGHAEKLHGQLSEPGRSVLIVISPNQRVLEIVTGTEARRRLPDRTCQLAALSMVASFSGGDLTGGIVAGLAQLADRAGKL